METEETDEDVLFRFELQKSDVQLTMLTASASSFEHADHLGPLVFGWENQIYVAFNSSVVERMMTDAIEKNGEEHGEEKAAFLALIKLIRMAIQHAEIYEEKSIFEEIVGDG